MHIQILQITKDGQELINFLAGLKLLSITVRQAQNHLLKNPLKREKHPRR